MRSLPAIVSSSPSRSVTDGAGSGTVRDATTRPSMLAEFVVKRVAGTYLTRRNRTVVTLEIPPEATMKNSIANEKKKIQSSSMFERTFQVFIVGCC